MIGVSFARECPHGDATMAYRCSNFRNMEMQWFHCLWLGRDLSSSRLYTRRLRLLFCLSSMRWLGHDGSTCRGSSPFNMSTGKQLQGKFTEAREVSLSLPSTTISLFFSSVGERIFVTTRLLEVKFQLEYIEFVF